MSRTRQYHKRQAKAIQRRRRTAAERLQRDHVQAQRAIKAFEEEIIFSQKLYWCFVDCEALELKALS